MRSQSDRTHPEGHSPIPLRALRSRDERAGAESRCPWDVGNNGLCLGGASAAIGARERAVCLGIAGTGGSYGKALVFQCSARPNRRAGIQTTARAPRARPKKPSLPYEAEPTCT